MTVPRSTIERLAFAILHADTSNIKEQKPIHLCNSMAYILSSIVALVATVSHLRSFRLSFRISSVSFSSRSPLIGQLVWCGFFHWFVILLPFIDGGIVTTAARSFTLPLHPHPFCFFSPCEACVASSPLPYLTPFVSLNKPVETDPFAVSPSLRSFPRSKTDQGNS
jgi:hypothetical protein